VTVLNALLPLTSEPDPLLLMQPRPSELASKQKAMKSATTNAEQLHPEVDRATPTRLGSRQITQEIREIVGGASALA